MYILILLTMFACIGSIYDRYATKKRLIEQLEKVLTNDCSSEEWKLGVKYAIDQIRRLS